MSAQSDDRDHLEALAAAGSRDLPPLPPGLEDRVVDSLRTRGLLRPPGAAKVGGGRRQWLAGAVGTAAGFAGGLLAGRRGGGGAPLRPQGPYWMLLLIEGEAFEAPSAGREAERVREYVDWAATLRRRQQLVDGAELAPPVVVMDGAAPDRAGVEPGDGGAVGGYFIVAAADLAGAQAIAADCPHLRYRGRIAIRRLL